MDQQPGCMGGVVRDWRTGLIAALAIGAAVGACSESEPDQVLISEPNTSTPTATATADATLRIRAPTRTPQPTRTPFPTPVFVEGQSVADYDLWLGALIQRVSPIIELMNELIDTDPDKRERLVWKNKSEEFTTLVDGVVAEFVGRHNVPTEVRPLHSKYSEFLRSLTIVEELHVVALANNRRSAQLSVDRQIEKMKTNHAEFSGLVDSVLAPLLPTATTVPPSLPTSPPEYDPSPGDPADCADFTSSEAAQSWWNRHRGGEHANPGGLDGDGDGAVCEAGGGAEVVPTQPPPPQAPAGPPCAGRRTCSEFGSQRAAQEYFERCGRPSAMDRDKDGRVCESLP